MPKIEAVFLDLGNVLAFHNDQVLCERLSSFGGCEPELIRSRLLKLWDGCNRGSLCGLDLRRAVCEAAELKQVLDVETFREVWSCHFRVHEEVMPLVKALLSRVKVLLLSNTNELHWTFVRPLIPLVEEFHSRVLSYELGLAKPDPEIFQEALRRAGTAPQASAFFDDLQIFVDAACSQGIHGRVFTDADHFRLQLAELGLKI